MTTFEKGDKGENFVVRFLEYIGATIIHKSNPNKDGDYDIRFSGEIVTGKQSFLLYLLFQMLS